MKTAEEETAMKYLALLSISCILLVAQGCTSLDQSGAGVESSVAEVPAVSPTPPPPASGGLPPASGQPDPSANGGSTLPASAPYAQDNSARVPQSVNPVPFLAGGQPRGAAAGNQAALSSSLTSRADGTMSGPTDLPAASTGWGVPVSSPASTGKAGKKTTAKPSGAARK